MVGYQVVGTKDFGPSRIIWPTKKEAEAYRDNYLSQFRVHEEWIIFKVEIHGVSEN